MVMTVDQRLGPAPVPTPAQLAELATGQVQVRSQASTSGVAAVSAQMLVPLPRAQVWTQVTRYSQWTQFFPNIVQSTLLETVRTPEGRYRRLHQVGSKGFMMLTAQVEIYLRVYERPCEAVQFRFERGTFSQFAADLTLADGPGGTLVTYTVEAAPTIPVPTFLIEQGMKHDLPNNLRQMRQVLCDRCPQVA